MRARKSERRVKVDGWLAGWLIWRPKLIGASLLCCAAAVASRLFARALFRRSLRAKCACVLRRALRGARKQRRLRAPSLRCASCRLRAAGCNLQQHTRRTNAARALNWKLPFGSQKQSEPTNERTNTLERLRRKFSPSFYFSLSLSHPHSQSHFRSRSHSQLRA